MKHPFHDQRTNIQEKMTQLRKTSGPHTSRPDETTHPEDESERKHLNQKRMKERKKTVLRQRLILAAAVVAAFLFVYLLIAHSYVSRFLPNTYLNGYEVGGMSETRAEQVLQNAVEKYSLEITFQDDKKEKLQSSQIGYQYVSSGESGKLLKAQNRMAWIGHLFGKKKNYQVKTSFRYDENALKDALFSLPEFQESNTEAPSDAHMNIRDNKFVIVPEKDGNQLNRNVSLSSVNAAVERGDGSINLYETENAYVRPTVTKHSEDLRERVKDLNAFISTKVELILKDGTKRTVGRKKLLTWVSRGDDGNYSVDKTSIADHSWNMVQAIADKFDNLKETMDFQTTNLGKKKLSCSPYGYKVDVDEVADQLSQDLLNHKSETIKIKNSVSEDADSDFGGTYIEVDVTNQHVYFYKNGSRIFDTDCVTGLESDPDRKTPSGVYAIYAKIPDKTLEGRLTADGPVTYTSEVSYWMPFYESYGMHDAPWRDEFGGTIYETSGSHGCVNLPVDAAATIYKNAEVGTTVVVVRDSD